jgi:Cell division protein
MAKNDRNIIRRRLVRSYITSVISISLVLTLLGAAAFFAVNANNIAAYFKENLVVSVMLKQSVKEKDAQAFAAELEKADYVRSAEYISKERGAEELKALLGEDFLNVFETTPVPMSIDLHLDGDAVSKERLQEIRDKLSINPKVEEVVYQESLVEALNSNLAKISLIVAAIAILLTIISFALISNTVRLNIYSRRFTIHTMRLVGAKRSFIRKPFVRQAVVLGAVSGILADAILVGLLYWVKNSSELLFSIFDMKLVYGVMVSLILLGILICALAAVTVVNKLAYASKDELYY